jgi:hypothetical protein
MAQEEAAPESANIMGISSKELSVRSLARRKPGTGVEISRCASIANYGRRDVADVGPAAEHVSDASRRVPVG